MLGMLIVCGFLASAVVMALGLIAVVVSYGLKRLAESDNDPVLIDDDGPVLTEP